MPQFSPDGIDQVDVRGPRPAAWGTTMTLDQYGTCFRTTWTMSPTRWTTLSQGVPKVCPKRKQVRA